MPLRARKVLLAGGCGAVALLSYLQTADAAGGLIRASCVEKGGAIVYREDLPADATADRRLAIATRYSPAMCVFLKIAELPPEYREPQQAAQPGLPTEILSGAAAGGMSSDESLAAALSVLTGKRDGQNGIAGPAASSFSNAWAQPLSSSQMADTRPKPVNLTIGIYKDIGMDDVIAHWKSMQHGTRLLSRMTPNMSVTGNITMLSIEDVQDADAAAVCDEAALVGSGCIAVY